MTVHYRYTTIGLMYTRTCPLTCRHCITESSPKIKSRMRQEHALAYLQAIRSFSPAVSFTGGEPMLFYEEIVELVKEAKRLELYVTLVSGAGWVKGETMAQKRMEALATAGLDAMAISWDHFHEEFSPREHAVLLARLARELNILVYVKTAITPGHPKGRQTAFDAFPVGVEAHTLIRLGRAASLPNSEFCSLDAPPKEFCTVIFTPVVEPDGVVYACCGPAHFSAPHSPLVLGNALIEPLDEILARAAQDPILEALRMSGPFGLYTLLQNHPIGRERYKARREYTSVCELCQDITNDRELLEALRERLQDRDAQIYQMASRLWVEEKLDPRLKKLRANNA